MMPAPPINEDEKKQLREDAEDDGESDDWGAGKWYEGLVVKSALSSNSPFCYERIERERERSMTRGKGMVSG